MPCCPTEVKSEVKDTHFSSKAYGQRDSKETKMDGRLQLDILQVMQRDYKLRSYSLNSVCAHFLGELIRVARLVGEPAKRLRGSPGKQASRKKTCTIPLSRSCKTVTRNREGDWPYTA